MSSHQGASRLGCCVCSCQMLLTITRCIESGMITTIKSQLCLAIQGKFTCMLSVITDQMGLSWRIQTLLCPASQLGMAVQGCRILCNRHAIGQARAGNGGPPASGQSTQVCSWTLMQSAAGLSGTGNGLHASCPYVVNQYLCCNSHMQYAVSSICNHVVTYVLVSHICT